MHDTNGRYHDFITIHEIDVPVMNWIRQSIEIQIKWIGYQITLVEKDKISKLDFKQSLELNTHSKISKNHGYNKRVRS